MRRDIATALVCVLVVAGCDGLGSPIVGSHTTEPPDEIDRCGADFACEPIRTLAPDHFDVPTEPASHIPTDCDDDLVEDEMDNCVGVWNPTQRAEECVDAESACAALRAGELWQVGADLRGCRIESVLELTESATFEAADLRCASLRFHASDARRIEFRGVEMTNVALEVSGPVVVDASEATLLRVSVHLLEGAKVHADRSVWNQSGMWIGAGPAVPGADPSPTVDVSASSMDAVTIFEGPSSRPGRVRLEDSSLQVVRISVPVLEVVSTTVRLSQLDADELDLVNADVSRSELRSEFAVISASEILSVVFDRCDDLVVVASELRDVDIPSCEPEAFYARETTIEGARIGGGLLLDECEVFASTVGGGAGSVVHTNDSVFDGVKFCDLEAGLFAGGELRCVRCDEVSFHGGPTVCLAGARLIAPHCVQLEFAPACE